MVVKRGFSIAECLVACTLVSGMSICLAAVWAMHAKATAHSREMLVASCWADQVMEEKLSQGYTCRSDAGPNPPFVVKHIVDGASVYSEYYYRTYVTDNPTPSNPGLKDVTVEVAWQRQGVWKNLHLVTRLGWQG